MNKLIIIKTISIITKGQLINHKIEERTEQEQAFKYIYPDDVVLELGGRYGTVSSIINYKL